MAITYSKNFFEKYAAYTLIDVFHIKEDDIILSDCPDLRIPSLDYGIEVTQALTKEEAIADKKKQLYASLDMTPFDHSHDDINFVIKKIDSAIKRKITKSKHYQSYKHNGLYIFSHCHNIQQEVILKYLLSLSYDSIFYHFIMINCVTHLYIFDYVHQNLTSYHYDKNDLIKMNIQSLVYDSTCSKKRRQIILEEDEK